MQVTHRHIFQLSIVGLVLGSIVVLGLSKFDDLVAALTPKPETFTELYFEDHLTLPRRVNFATPTQVSYTLHNLEHQATEYTIETTIEYETEPPLVLPLVETQTLVLEHDQYKTLPLAFTVPEIVAPRAKIIIRIKNLDQTIHFWVDLPTVPGSPSPTPPLVTPTPPLPSPTSLAPVLVPN